MRSKPFASVLLAPFLVLAFVSARALDRDADPVVISAAELPWLLGVAPGEIVAFRYDGGWQQIPLQVDERATVDFATIYGDPNPSGYTIPVYTDAGTYTGADADPTLDPDDEVVFMARHAGPIRAQGVAMPEGTQAASEVEVRITDPLDESTGYAYLFLRQGGGLDPAAGQELVRYEFRLLDAAGQPIPYLGNYRTLSGPNPEDSEIVGTARYRIHFADRWLRDETEILVGGVPNGDLLDTHKFKFAPGTCTRSETTFNNGEGAFITNKPGPLRAIRAYVGANSGALTTRQHWFYERREDVITDLRVHPIPGLLDTFDLSALAAAPASAMTYASDVEPAGVAIDGNPDSVASGDLRWEMVRGALGSLIHAHALSTDLPYLDRTSYYLDDTTPGMGVPQCSGDGHEFGNAGPRHRPTVDDPNGQIGNTDPALLATHGELFIYSAHRTIYFEAPHASPALAAELEAQASTPLVATPGRRQSPVPPRPPVPIIRDPRQVITIGAGDPFQALAFGVDYEDGVLPASAFSWWLDEPGGRVVKLLGGSRALSTILVRPGRYGLRLRATDRSGLSAEDRVTVVAY